MPVIEGIDEKKYLGFKLINVVAALYNPHNKPLIDPFSLFFGRWRASRTFVRKENLEGYLMFESQEKSFITVFNPDRIVSAYTGQRTADEHVIERVKLSSLSLDLLVENVKIWLHQRYGNQNLWREGGTKVFTNTNTREPHEGEIWLNGNVRIKGKALIKGSDGEKGSFRSKFHSLSIAGPFEASAVKLGNLKCDCYEFDNILRKHGYSRGEYLCPEIGALLYYARYTPTGVRNLESIIARRNTKIWLPFHPFEIQPVTGEYRTIKKGAQPRISNLMVTAMLIYLSAQKGENKAYINKGLKRLEVTYDKILKELIAQGKAGFEAIAQEWIWDRENEIWGPLWAWKDDGMHNYLTKTGFEFKGLVVEKERTQHETTAMEYLKKINPGHSVRLLFFDGMPPLVLERIVLPRYKVDIFALERRDYRPPEQKHFYEELYVPKITYDHRRCRFTFSEVRFAPEIWNPQEMMPDYYKTLRHFYGDNAINRLRVQINRIRPSQFKKLEMGKEAYNIDSSGHLRLVNTIGKYGA